MNRVHLANTDFEFELAHPSRDTLENGWNKNPISLQLQYLPLLYAKEEDIVAVAEIPDPAFLQGLKDQAWRKGAGLPQMALLQEIDPFVNCECVSWGYSQQVQAWAHQRKMKYEMPDWPVVQEVNSKAFSHRYTTLKDATLLWNEQELKMWLQSFSGKKVLKSCFGLSGKGLYIIQEKTSNEELIRFCEKEWKQQRPIVAEPWLERVFDFSTQWNISPEGGIECVGSTVFETNAYGTYNATVAGPEASIFGPYLSFLEAHKHASRIVLQEMFKKGFFGNVGIDALLYKCHERSKICLYPIVEVNARKTMSWVALMMQQRWFVDRTIRFEFLHASSSGISLLPAGLQGRKLFSHGLFLSY